MIPCNSEIYFVIFIIFIVNFFLKDIVRFEIFM